MYTIRKEFHFSAAHMLAGLPADHPCSRLHGHNYIVVVELRSAPLDERAFVIDYGELHEFKALLDDHFDHRFLHFEDGKLSGLTYYGEGVGALSSLQPTASTAENLACFFWGWCADVWPETWAVEVSETPKTWARYCPHDAGFDRDRS